MNILTRLMRIFQADLHAIIDRLEDKTRLLKQYLRDMEEALEHKETKLNSLIVSQQQIQQEEQHYTQELAKLDQDLLSAIQKQKDDLARGGTTLYAGTCQIRSGSAVRHSKAERRPGAVVLKQIKTLTMQRDDLAQHRVLLSDRITQVQDGLAEQRLRYQQIRLRADTYFRRRVRSLNAPAGWFMTPVNVLPEPSAAEIELELLQRKEALQGGILP